METEEIFRVSVEQAKRSVARHGFTFMSVIGSDPRILEIYSQKPKFKRLRRKSPTTKSLIEPLTASQFINSHKFQKNSLNKAPTSRYLPTSKGSIIPRFMPSRNKQSVKEEQEDNVFNVNNYSNTSTNSKAPPTLTLDSIIKKRNKDNNKEKPVSAKSGSNFFQLVTPSTVFSEDEDNITPSVVRNNNMNRMFEDNHNGINLEHDTIVNQNAVVSKMLQYNNTDDTLRKFKAVESKNLVEENARIHESVNKIYGGKRGERTLKDRINSKNSLLQNIEMFDTRGKELSARGIHRNANYYHKQIIQYGIILRGQNNGTFSKTKASRFKAFFSRAYAHAQVNNLKDALNDFSKCLEIDNTYSEAYYNRALVFRSLLCHASAYKDLSDAVKRTKTLEKRRIYRLAQAFVQRELGFFKHAGDDLKKNMTTKEYSDLLDRSFKNEREEEEKKEAERIKKFNLLKQRSMKKKTSIFDITRTAKGGKGATGNANAALMGVIRARRKFKNVVSSKYEQMFRSAGYPNERPDDKVNVLIDQIGQLKCLVDVPRDILFKYCQQAETKIFKGGSYVYKPGDSVGKIYIVLSGVVRLMYCMTRPGHQTIEVTTKTLHKGDWFGTLSLKRQENNSIYVQSTCEVMCIKRYIRDPKRRLQYTDTEKDDGKSRPHSRNQMRKILKSTNYDKHITKDSIIKAVGNDAETDATSVDQKTTSSSNILLQRTESLLNNAAEHNSSEPESLLYEMFVGKRVKLLKSSYVFHSMLEEMIYDIARSGKFIEKSVGTKLIAEGEFVDRFCVIQRGTCKVTRRINNLRKTHGFASTMLWKNEFRNVLEKQSKMAKPGAAALQKQREKEKQCTYQDVVISTLGPGDVFGELAILSNGTLVPSPVTVHADTGVELLIITANELRQYVRGGYFQRETGRLLRNYMCLKVPSADTVKNNVDTVTKWTSKKKEIVLNEVRLSAKNSQSTGSRIMRLNYTDANEIEELKKLLKKKHDWN